MRKIIISKNEWNNTEKYSPKELFIKQIDNEAKYAENEKEVIEYKFLKLEELMSNMFEILVEKDILNIDDVKKILSTSKIEFEK